MNNSITQQQEELAVFKSFLTVCKYEIVGKSIIQQDPPKPDILCAVRHGQKIEFELTNAIDSNLAKKMNDNKIIEKGGFCDDPIEKIVLSKNQKLKKGQYKLSSDRFELLVYTGRMPIFTHWNKTIPLFFEKYQNELLFNRVWIFCDDLLSPKVLWQCSRSVRSDL